MKLIPLILLCVFVVNKSIFVYAEEEAQEIVEQLDKMDGPDFVRVFDRLNNPVRSNKDNVDLLIEKVNNLRPWMADQMSWIDCVFYYSASITIIFVFTSTLRTLGVRFPLFVLLLGNFVSERLLYSYNVQNLYLSDYAEYYYSDLMYQIWMLRYFVLICMIIRYIFHYIRHRNVELVNSQLLKNIYNQNEVLLQKLNALQNAEDQFDIIIEKPNSNDDINKVDKEAENNLPNDDKKEQHSFNIATIKDLREKLFKSSETNNSPQTDELPKYSRF